MDIYITNTQMSNTKGNSNQEIEIKLKYLDKDKVIKVLEPGMTFQGNKHIRDFYYGDKGKTMKNTEDLLRLRVISDAGAELTFKGNTKEKGNIWKRKELTTEVSDYKIMEQILRALHLDMLFSYESHKEYWQYKDTEICFVKFTKPSTLVFMEIEAPTMDAIKETRKKLGNIVQEVGEEIFDVFEKSRNL